jgi:hypothetical protein
MNIGGRFYPKLFIGRRPVTYLMLGGPFNPKNICEFFSARVEKIFPVCLELTHRAGTASPALWQSAPLGPGHLTRKGTPTPRRTFRVFTH